MAVWGLGFFEAPSSRTNTFSAATGCAAVMGRSVGNVPAALTFLPSSVYWIPSQEKGLEIGFRKHGRVSGNTTAGPVVGGCNVYLWPGSALGCNERSALARGHRPAHVTHPRFPPPPSRQ